MTTMTFYTTAFLLRLISQDDVSDGKVDITTKMDDLALTNLHIKNSEGGEGVGREDGMSTWLR
jgi:hypothetical protein